MKRYEQRGPFKVFRGGRKPTAAEGLVQTDVGILPTLEALRLAKRKTSREGVLEDQRDTLLKALKEIRSLAPPWATVRHVAEVGKIAHGAILAVEPPDRPCDSEPAA